MSQSTSSKIDEEPLKNLIGFFDSQVLATYENEPNKYVIETDYFEGRLYISEHYYYEQLEEDAPIPSIDIQFGYRTLKNGDLALAIWLPDLFEKSKEHVNRWTGFYLKNPEWTDEIDERFNLWLKRYIDGSWEVDNGPNFYLGQTIKSINALTCESLGCKLFAHELDTTLKYPTAENTHKYQDAHKELYGYMIDGLDKDCISRLADRMSIEINVANEKTVNALMKILPELDNSVTFTEAYDIISSQRRLASHGVREKATRFNAFERFTQDLNLCLEAMKILLALLEGKLNMDSELALKRHNSKKMIPKIVRPPEPHYSICRVSSMEGKTIDRVEFGFRQDIEDVHQSEMVIVYFTDGSIMSIDTGSNAANLNSQYPELKPEDFHVDFRVLWVPPL